MLVINQLTLIFSVDPICYPLNLNTKMYYRGMTAFFFVIFFLCFFFLFLLLSLFCFVFILICCWGISRSSRSVHKLRRRPFVAPGPQRDLLVRNWGSRRCYCRRQNVPGQLSDNRIGIKRHPLLFPSNTDSPIAVESVSMPVYSS